MIIPFRDSIFIRTKEVCICLRSTKVFFLSPNGSPWPQLTAGPMRSRYNKSLLLLLPSIRGVSRVIICSHHLWPLDGAQIVHAFFPFSLCSVREVPSNSFICCPRFIEILPFSSSCVIMSHLEGLGANRKSLFSKVPVCELGRCRISRKCHTKIVPG